MGYDKGHIQLGTLRTQIVERLRADIVTGVLRPGEIVRDFELAQRYGTSTSPVREALFELARESLIIMPPNQSKRVSPLDKKTTLDMFSVYEILALNGFKWGARNVDASHIALMKVAQKRLEDAAHQHDRGTIMSAMRDLVDPVYLAADNRELRRALANCVSWLDRLFYLLLPLEKASSDWLRLSSAIVKAFEAKDAAAAISLFEGSLAATGKYIRNLPELY